MTIQNGINNDSMMFNYGSLVTNPVWVNANSLNAGTGDIDLYTVPSGKKALIFGFGVYNPTGGGIAVYPEIKIAGVYTRLNNGQTVATISGVANIMAGNSNKFALDTGDTIALNTASSGLNIWVAVFEFISPNFKVNKILGLANGNNTIYTVPGGKTALILGNTQGPGFSSDGVVGYFNLSGGSRSIQLYYVESGGTPGTTNQVYNNATVTNTTFLTNALSGVTLSAGDSVVIATNAGTATQNAYLNVWET